MHFLLTSVYVKKKEGRGIVPKKAGSGQFTEVIIETSNKQTPLLDPIHDCGTNQLISTELGQVSLKVYHLYRLINVKMQN